MSGFTDEHREELADAALAAERRNRSRGLVVFGALALVVSLGVLAWAWSVRSGAVQTLERERSRLEQVRGLAVGFEAIKEREARGLLAIQAPDRRLLGTIKQAGTDSGLIDLPETPIDSETSRDGGVTERRVKYDNVRSDAVGPLIRWIDLACQRVPGLRVWELALEPRGGQWVLDVTFIRWEREEPDA